MKLLLMVTLKKRIWPRDSKARITPIMVTLLSVLFTASKAYLIFIVDFIILVLTLLYLVDRIFFLMS